MTMLVWSSGKVHVELDLCVSKGRASTDHSGRDSSRQTLSGLYCIALEAGTPLSSLDVRVLVIGVPGLSASQSVPHGQESATNQSIKSNKYPANGESPARTKMRSCISALTEGAGQVTTGMTGELRVAYMKSCQRRLSLRELPFRAVRIADSSPLRQLEGRRVG